MLQIHRKDTVQFSGHRTAGAQNCNTNCKAHVEVVSCREATQYFLFHQMLRSKTPTMNLYRAEALLFEDSLWST